jgi:hypothetical protein
MIALWLMTGLLVKHFIGDYPFQLKYMLEEKGYYLRAGGIHHATAHGLGTAFVFTIFDFKEVAGAMMVLDLLIHYHVDYLKSRINDWAELSPNKDRFWHLMGLDQLAHQLTYVLLVGLALAK